MLASFETTLFKNEYYIKIKNKDKKNDIEIDEKNLATENLLKMLKQGGEPFKAHEDGSLFHSMSQLRNVIKELTMEGWQPAERNMTHILFLSLWET